MKKRDVAWYLSVCSGEVVTVLYNCAEHKGIQYKYHGMMEWMARSMVIEWDLVNQWLSWLLRHGEREGKFGRLKKMCLNWEKGNCGRKLYKQEKTENISWSVIEWTRFSLIFMQSNLLHCATNIFVLLSSPCIEWTRFSPIFVQMGFLLFLTQVKQLSQVIRSNL